MTNLRLSLLSALLLAVLTGCGSIGEGEVQQNYVLPVPPPQAQTPALPWHLTVMPVDVAAGLDTTRIALIEHDVQMNYLAASKWAEPLPQMLQFIWIQALKQNGLAASVGSDSDTGKADRLIHVTATAFNAIRTNDGSLVVRVGYEAKVIAPGTHAVLSVEDSMAEEKAPSESMEGVMQTFNEANAWAMHELLAKLAADLKVRDEHK